MVKACEYEAKQNINSSKNTMKKLKFFVQTHWKKLLQWILTKQDFEDIGFSKLIKKKIYWWFSKYSESWKNYMNFFFQGLRASSITKIKKILKNTLNCLKNNLWFSNLT